ncbi:hypothetical protein BJ875DRAFT_55204 [Amylocarpus encephaloides]|uniref:Uncharacterized protein n=1 Tax=Amylocarpus encephaloides TaxID=45428 RepID=A0A9P7YGE5_9HELO|nr:hypothetical protein BJ875DRAFT_55204 [Amylocarpus encephaloides]
MSYQPLQSQPHEKLDKALFTRNVCAIGLCASWLTGFAALGGGCYCLYLERNDNQEKRPEFIIPHFAKEMLPLGINIILTFLNESMGYIHSTSLRWSLQYENRLTFNSNLRLLSSSGKSLPNKWYSNIFFLICLILSYATTSLIFLGWNPQLSETFDNTDSSTTPDNLIYVSGVALIIFGLSLLGQATIATWALTTTYVPTWSSNPLDTVVACTLRYNPNTGKPTPNPLIRHTNRCMKSVHQLDEPPNPTQPKAKQGPALTAHPEVRWVLTLLWALVPLGGVWGGSIYTMIIKKNEHGILGSSWQFLPMFTGISNRADSCPAARCTDGTSVLNVGWTRNSGTIGNIGSIFLIASFQAGLTLALHCAELLVNLSRDETVVRMAISEKGTDPRFNSILAAFSSWQTIILFLFKAAVHWLFGLSINNDFEMGVNMYPPQIFYFTAFALAVAIFSTYVSARRPKGPMPATFGHLQTMADVIDEWDDRMFWGEKGSELGLQPAYAGMSYKKLPMPKRHKFYGGVEMVSAVVVHGNVSQSTIQSNLSGGSGGWQQPWQQQGGNMYNGGGYGGGQRPYNHVYGH